MKLANELVERNKILCLTTDCFKNGFEFYRFKDEDLTFDQKVHEPSWREVSDNGIFQHEFLKEVLSSKSDLMNKSSSIEEILFEDENKELLDYVRPIRYTDPEPCSYYDMVAIGGGAGGLVTAIFVQLSGGRAALIEKNLLGGDCLNNGCVPSKTLLMAAKAANTCRNAAKYGLKVNMEIDFKLVMERLRKI